MKNFENPGRNPVAVEIENVLAEAGIENADVTSPTEFRFNHINVTTPKALSINTTKRVHNIATQTGASIRLEVRDASAKPIRDEAGGLTYAEMEAAQRTAALIAGSQGGSDAGLYLPRGAQHFGSH